ncbi:MAG: hypothetical protein PVF65_10240 [Sphingomonadales bacterium]|jgi:hypothetical protein
MQQKDIPAYDHERWKIAGFESKEQLVEVVARIRKAAQAEDVHPIFDMFDDGFSGVNCTMDDRTTVRTYVHGGAVEDLQALWKALLQHEKFARLKSLSYDDLFLNYQGARAHSLWITRIGGLENATPPVILSINSPLSCEELIKLFPNEPWSVAHEEQWRFAQFESKAQVEDFLTKVRKAAQAEDIYLIEDGLSGVPFFVGCHLRPSLFQSSRVRVDTMEELQHLWGSLFALQFKTLSYEDLSFDKRGASASRGVTISFSLQSDWGPMMASPQIYWMDSSLACDDVVQILKADVRDD